jgi:hypothetical protein
VNAPATVRSARAWLLVKISTKTGKVMHYGIYSEASPTTVDRSLWAVVQAGHGASFQDAKRHIVEHVRMRAQSSADPLYTEILKAIDR